MIGEDGEKDSKKEEYSPVYKNYEKKYIKK